MGIWLALVRPLLARWWRVPNNERHAEEAEQETRDEAATNQSKPDTDASRTRAIVSVCPPAVASTPMVMGFSGPSHPRMNNGRKARLRAATRLSSLLASLS